MISGTGVRQSRDAFTRAGLDPNEAERLYIEAMKSSGGYQEAKYHTEASQYQAPSQPLYQGAVREGMDVEHFQETGEEIPYVPKGDVKSYLLTGGEQGQPVPTGGRPLTIKKPEPAPLSVSAYEEPTAPMKQSWGESTIQTLGRYPTGLKMSITGAITDFDIGAGIKYTFQPFQYSGEMRGEKKITVPAREQRGTIVSEEYLSTEYKPFTGTKFEYAEMMESKGYQPSQDLYERTGKRIPKYAPAVIEIGALTVLSGTPMGAMAVRTFIGLKGTKQFVEAETFSGKALGLVGIGMGIYGISSGMRGLQRSITMDELSSAIASKPQVPIGERVSLGEGVVKDIYGARYQVGGTKVIKQTEIYSKLMKGKYYPQVGRGEVYAKTYEFGTGKEILYGAGTKLEGLGLGLGVGTGGWQPSISSGQISKQIEFITRAGKGKLTIYPPSAQVKEPFLAGAISKQSKEMILSYGGKVKDINLPWKTPSGIVIERGRYGFDVEQISLLKIAKPSPSDIGFMRGAGGKSSQEFFKQLYAPPTQAIAEKLIQAPIVDTSTSILPSISTGVGAIVSKVKVKEDVKTSYAEISKSFIKEFSIQPQVSKVKVITKEQDAFANLFGAGLMPKPSLRDITILGTPQAQIPRTKLKSEQILKQITIQTPIITTPTTPTPYIPTTTFVPAPFMFLPPLGAGGRPSKRRIKVRKIVGYTPSYSAMIFKIFGEKPKGVETGLRIRPIPKDFDFTRLMGMGTRRIIKTRKVKRR